MPGIEPMPPPIHEQRMISHQLLEAVLHALPLALVDVLGAGLGRDRDARDQQVAQLRQREDAEQHRRQRQAVPQIEAVDGPAQRAGLRIGADHRDHDAEAAGGDAAQRRVAATAPRPSICRAPRRPAAPAIRYRASPAAGSGCDIASSSGAEQAAHQRRHVGGAERAPGLAALRHRDSRRARSPPRRRRPARRTGSPGSDRRSPWWRRGRAAARTPRRGPCRR